MKNSPKLKIGIIGSGLAGLSAGWLLSKHHDVTIFEKEGIHGMDAHSVTIQVDGELKRVDIPLRIFVKSFYPHLSEFYAHIGVEFNTENIDTSCSDLEGNEFLGYKNVLIGNRYSIPFFSFLHVLFKPSLLKHYLGMIYLVWTMGKHISTDRERLKKKTFQQYLRDEGFSTEFLERVFIPMLCLVCTCSYEALCNYPAEVIVDYCTKVFLRFGGVQKVTYGTQDVVDKLSKDCKLLFNANLQSVTRDQNTNELLVTNEDGSVERFNHIIFATPPHTIVKLLQIDAPQIYQVLGKFRSEKSVTVLHRDVNLLPKDQAMWRSINLIAVKPHTAPMASIWVNRVHRVWSTLIRSNIFQTWNPLIEPHPDKVLCRAELYRPIVNEESLEGLDLLKEIQGKHNIWFVGSWSLWGIPLLENAARSGLDVAEKIGPVLRPWVVNEISREKNNFFYDTQIYLKYTLGILVMLLCLILATI